MDFFESLWKDPGQAQIPDEENFKLLTENEWMKYSSTYKIINMSLQDPHEGLGLDVSTKEQDPMRSDAYTDRRQVSPTKKTTKAKRTKQVQQSKHKNQQSEVSACSTITDEVKDGSDNDETKDEVEMDSEDDDDTAVESIIGIKRYVPGARKNPVSEKLSSLDFFEHADCLRLFLKFMNSNCAVMKPSDRADHVLFEVLYKKVQEEQKLFLQDAQNQWTETAKEVQDIQYDRKLPVHYVWMNKVKNAMEIYPHMYVRKSMIPLFPREKRGIEMLKTSDLLQMGKIPACFIPTFKTRSRAQIQTSKVLSSARCGLSSDQIVGSLHKLPVSLDPNAESLARLNKVQIVISFGALKVLLSTHFDHFKSWTLPITVKEYRTIEMGRTTTKTIVFIDKPLPKPTMTVDECNQILFKYAVRSRLLQEKHTNSFVFPIAGVELLEKENVAKSSESLVEKNEVAVPSEKAEESVKENEGSKETEEAGAPNVVKSIVEEEICTEDSDEERLVIELESPTGPTKPNDKPEVKEDVVAGDEAPKITDCPATEKSSTAATGKAEKRFFQPRKDGKRLPKSEDGFTLPLSSTNVTYSCWVIRPDDKLNPHNRRSSELAVIVRCRVDGFLVGKSKEDAHAVSLSSKVEHQLEFAAEEATKNELVTEWASLYFKPASFVLRTRVDLKQAELVMHERKDKVQLNADAHKLYGIRLADSLETLYTVFSEVSTLSKGSYLLRHSREDDTFASLEESVDEAAVESKPVRSLREYFGQEFSVIKDENPPWPKLDCTLVLPKHEMYKVMPATYRPRPCMKVFKPTQKNTAQSLDSVISRGRGLVARKTKGKKKQKKKKPGKQKKKSDEGSQDDE